MCKEKLWVSKPTKTRGEGMSELSTEQRVWNFIIKDDRVKCTCFVCRMEDSFYQAGGHYRNCMLYQITRAIRLTLKETVKHQAEPSEEEVMR